MKYTLFGLTLLMLVSGCTKKSADSSQPQTGDSVKAEGTSSASGKKWKTSTGLEIEVLKDGSGSKESEGGQQVSVHYTGWLKDGKKFDSSVDRGQPFQFGLGAGMVIKGWDEGVKGMKIGEKRKLTIPPELGYGDRDVGGGLIPAHSTLVFEVELLGIN